jgi:hypothetical protein
MQQRERAEKFGESTVSAALEISSDVATDVQASAKTAYATPQIQRLGSVAKVALFSGTGTTFF